MANKAWKGSRRDAVKKPADRVLTIERPLHFFCNSQDLLLIMAASVVTVTGLALMVWITPNLLVKEIYRV
jgi:hypothetical protein